MLSIRVDDDVYGLDDSSSSELLRRLEDASPVEEGQHEPQTTLDKLRDAVDSDEATRLDDGDLPGDGEELRHAIAARLG